eukprot:scaffold2280_cov430-Prasinococcus_capsulatus_cf.AAC.2
MVESARVSIGLSRAMERVDQYMSLVLNDLPSLLERKRSQPTAPSAAAEGATPNLHESNPQGVRE